MKNWQSVKKIDRFRLRFASAGCALHNKLLIRQILFD